MQNNTKLLVIFSLLIVILGLGSLFIGFNSSNQNSIQTTPLEASRSATLGISGDQTIVTKVIDGDTIEILGGEKVRLLGVDTPETVDPRRPVGCFGKESSNKLKGLIEGKIVFLQKDVSETDSYKRLLRFVYLPLDSGDVLFVNDYLIREGYAKVLTIPPNIKFSEQFLGAQQQARESNRGLWGSC